MKTNHKVKAFTLSEVLIVLVITSIVIAIAFSILRLVTKQYNAISTRYTERAEILKLKQRMLTDMDISKSAFWDSDQEQLSLMSGRKESTSINYEVYDNLLIRNGDTLSKNITTISFFYKGNTVQGGAVDAFEVSIGNDKDVTNFFISTRLSALQKIEEVWD